MDIDNPTDAQAAGSASAVDPDEERRRRSGAILVAVVVALLVLWWILTQTTVVPDLSGMPEVQARHALRDASLKAGVVSEVRSRQHRPGTVAEQSPFAGIRVMKGSDIDFALAVRAGAAGSAAGGRRDSPRLFGSSLVGDEIDSGSTLEDPDDPRSTYVERSVPMVQALTEAEAVESLHAAGYRVRVKYGPVTTGPSKGKVFYQDPEPDALEPGGTLVEIWVSTGGVGVEGYPYAHPTLVSPP